MNKISVVIPTLNEENFIGFLLKDLKRQTLKPHQIIVVDGHSSDKTVDRARQFGITLLKTKRGVGFQRTVGAKHVTGDLVYFLDADVRLKPNFLFDTRKVFNERNIDIAVPLYLPYKSTLLISAVYWFFNIIFFLFQKIAPSGAGSCIIIRSNVLQKAGYFKSDLTYDDIEFIRRVSGTYRFEVILQKLYVSDRRFRESGTIKLFFLYLLLSLFFLIGQFRLANLIQYSFGSHKGSGGSKMHNLH